MSKLTAARLREILGTGEIVGDPYRLVTGVSPPEEAAEGDLTFVFSKKWLRSLSQVKASVVVLPYTEGLTPSSSTTYIMVERIEEAMIRLLSLFIPTVVTQRESVSPMAFVSPLATLEEGARVYPFAFVDDGAHIGKGAVIMSHVFIGKDAKIGEGVLIYPGAVVYPGVVIEKDSIIHAGAVLGADGFGYVEFQGQRTKIPQVGKVRIEEKVEIGANTCIDRATMGTTVVGEGTKLDNLVQIGHNVKIGKHCAFAAQVGISGSVRIGDRVLMGGQAGVADHAFIGSDSMIGAKSGIAGRVPKGSIVMGSPALPHRVFKRVQGALTKLPEMVKRVRALEKALERLKDERDGY